MMNAIVEKRNSLRVDVDCKLHCKKAGISEIYEVFCVNISCSGISFFCNSDFQIGEEVEIRIIPEPHVIPKSQFFVKIVRCEHQADGSFAIGAAIVFKDEDQDN